MTDEKSDQLEPAPSPEEDQTVSRFPELDELQQEVARRLKDNQKFLAHFLDEDFSEDLDEEDEPSPDDFEEL